MSTFNNDLRLKEITTGAESGTWGTSTNTNLSLVAEAFSYGTEAITTNADTHTTTISDASSAPGRSLYLKYTGTLDSACTITLAPNTVSKVWFIENATSGSQNIIISQGSGSNVTIPNGSVMAVYSDGGGGSANIVSVLTDVVLTDSVKITGTTPTLTLGDGDAEDAKIVFDGNAQDYHIGLDDSSDDLVIGKGTALGTTDALVLKNTMSGSSGNITLGGSSYALDVFKSGGGEMVNIASDGGSNGTYIRMDTDNSNPIKIGMEESNGHFEYYHNGTLRAQFESDGDLRLHTAGKGIMLKSPDGSNFLLTVSNAGALVIG
jgi:hypothetical protein